MHLFRSPLGDLVPGAFPVPDNPILLGVAQQTGLTNLGDLVDASFPIPQNPITAPTSMDRPKILTPADTRNAIVRQLTAAKTGPVASGVGQVDATSVLQSTGQFLDQSLAVGSYNVPYWVLGGALLALYLFTGGSDTRYSRLRKVHGG